MHLWSNHPYHHPFYWCFMFSVSRPFKLHSTLCSVVQYHHKLLLWVREHNESERWSTFQDTLTGLWFGSVSPQLPATICFKLSHTEPSQWLERLSVISTPHQPQHSTVLSLDNHRGQPTEPHHQFDGCFGDSLFPAAMTMNTTSII